MILSGVNSAISRKGCTKCLDCWSSNRIGVHGRIKIYPIGLKESMDKAPCNPPSVELSFGMIENSIKHLQEWMGSAVDKKEVKRKASLPKIGRQ